MNPTQSFSFKGRDGTDISAYAWLPKDDSVNADQPKPLKGIIQISHGMAEHALRYGRFAKALNNAGYIVYAHDHRGHGKTCPQDQNPGFFADKNGWALVVDDVYQLNQLIQSKYPTLPITLFGHSMGTFISQQYVAEHGETVNGLMLSASISDAGFLRKIALAIAKMERFRIGAHGQSKLLNTMSFADFNKPFKPNRSEFDWLSRDSIEVDKYIKDPLCGFIVSTQLWIDLLEGLGEMALPATRKRVPNSLPILLITGSDDPVTKQGKTVDALKMTYEKAGMNNVSVNKYAGGRHESLNEINRNEITADLIQWIKSL